MQTMHEALARQRMSEAHERAHRVRLSRELAAQRRWHRVAAYARHAESRHERRARYAAER